MVKNISFWKRFLALTTLDSRKQADVIVAQNKTFSHGILVRFSSNLLFILAFGALIYFGIRGGRRALEVFSITAANWFFFMGLCAHFEEKFNKVLVNYPFTTPILLDLSVIFRNIISVLFVMVIVFFIGNLIGLKFNYVESLWLFIHYLLFGIAYGATVCTLVSMSQPVKTVHVLFRRVLFFLSSIIFSVPEMPREVRDFLLYNPLVHLNETFESTYTNIEYDFIDMNYFYLFLLALIIFSVVVYLIRVRDFKLQKEI